MIIKFCIQYMCSGTHTLVSPVQSRLSWESEC